MARSCHHFHLLQTVLILHVNSEYSVASRHPSSEGGTLDPTYTRCVPYSTLEIPQLVTSSKHSLIHTIQDGRQGDHRDRYAYLPPLLLLAVLILHCLELRCDATFGFEQKADPSISILDYSLANPDTLTKYKTAAQISQKVLETVACTHYPLSFLHILLPGAAHCAAQLQPHSIRTRY